MGKRSNLISIRKKSFNLKNFQKNKFVFNYQLLEYFKQLFFKKNVIISEEFLNISSNFYFFSANVFFKTKQLKLYKSAKNSQNNKSNCCLESSLFKKLSKNNFLNKINVSFNFRVLNNYLQKDFLLFFFKKLKVHSTVLFSRRFGMFIDFIKLTCLFFYFYLSLDSYLKLIADVFKFLKKKNHSKFFSFLKFVFELILSPEVKQKFITTKTSIKGLKLIIQGRLKGKPMASKIIIKSGCVPSQTISADIQYSTAPSFTQNYGVFGFKMWFYKSSSF